MEEKLSYTNLFNQQKIISDVGTSASVSSAGTLGTIVSIATSEPVTPTARGFIEYNGVMAPLYGSTAATLETIGQTSQFYMFFNALNGLVVQTVSFSAYSPTIYTRIYKDGQP